METPDTLVLIKIDDNQGCRSNVKRLIRANTLISISVLINPKTGSTKKEAISAPPADPARSRAYSRPPIFSEEESDMV